MAASPARLLSGRLSSSGSDQTGIGPLYRHFLTREAPVLEAYRHEVKQSAAGAAAEDSPFPVRR